MNQTTPAPASFWLTWKWGFMVVAVTAALWWLCFRFPSFWVIVGIGEPNRPFLDLYAWLAALDAQRQGLALLVPNPLDPYHRPFGFSSWWIELGALGFTRQDLLWLGQTLIGTTLVAAVAMVRPRQWREALALGLLLVSPAVLLGINRANQDLVIFLVISLGLVCFRTTRGLLRILGVVLFAVGAVLKFFPLVTVVLLLEFRQRKGVRAGAAVYALVLLLAWPSLEPALRVAGRFVPSPEGLYAFGAGTLARDFGWTVPSVLWLLPALAIGGWAFWGAFCAPVITVRTEADATLEREFICAAAILVGIFFLGVSYSYKLVFAVWMLPWLWQRRTGHPETRWARWIGGLLLALAWFEGMAAIILNSATTLLTPESGPVLLQGVLVVAQVLGWALIACLLRFLARYAGGRARALWSAPPAGAKNTLPGVAP